MHIELLADHARFIEELVAGYESEWPGYYGEAGPGDARADLAARCNRDRLPIGLVAVDGDRLVGTAAIDRDAATGLAPSVVGLRVAPATRRQGVASALIESAERLACELGYDELFISTSVLHDALRRRGWRERGDAEFLNGERGKVLVRILENSEST